MRSARPRQMLLALLVLLAPLLWGCATYHRLERPLLAQQHLLLARGLSYLDADQSAANESLLALSAEPSQGATQVQMALAARDLNLDDWAVDTLASSPFVPSRRELWDDLINYCYQDHRPQLVSLCQNLLTYDPFDAQTCNTLAYFYAQQGVRLSEAETLVQRALALDPYAAEVLDTLGWVYYKQGRFAQALKYLERAVQDPAVANMPEVIEHLAAAHEALGNRQQAEVLRRRLAAAREEQRAASPAPERESRP